MRILETDVELVVAVGRRLHHLVHVQQRHHRLAKLRIVGRRLRIIGRGDVHPPIFQRQDSDLRILLQFGHRHEGQVFHPVQLTGAQPGHARAGLGHDAEGHGVEAGQLVAAEASALLVFGVRRVAVIALHLHMAARQELHQLPRPGAHGAQLLRRILLEFGREDHDRLGERADELDEGWLALLHRHHEGGGIRPRPAFDVVEDLALIGLRLVAVPRSHDIGRGHCLAVVELDPLAQLKSVDQPVRRFGEGFREIGDRVVGLVARHQRLEHVHRDIARRNRARRHLVERIDVRLLAEHEVAAHFAALERRGQRRGVA